MAIQVRPSRDLRNNYPEISRLAKENHSVIITNKGKGDIVVISMENYADYEEFLHRQYILKELSKATEEAKDPDAKWHNHEEIWAEIWNRRDRDV